MVALDTDPPSTVRPSVPNSSSSTVTLPAGAQVQWAGLYWSADAGASDTWTKDLTSVLVRAPGGGYQQVTGETIGQMRDSAGRSYYQSSADVTALVKAGGAGSWSVADVALAATQTDAGASYYAGWALVVVYDDPASPSGATTTVYDGAAWLGAGHSAAVAVDVAAGSQVSVGAVAWNADAATAGDRLSLGGTRLTPVAWAGGPGSANNAFDSTAAGWVGQNSRGVDAKMFVPITSQGPATHITAATAADQFMLGVLTVTTAVPGQ
jgi:hypothetical protein